jgi:hypothetical protein
MIVSQNVLDCCSTLLISLRQSLHLFLIIGISAASLFSVENSWLTRLFGLIHLASILRPLLFRNVPFDMPSWSLLAALFHSVYDLAPCLDPSCKKSASCWNFVAIATHLLYRWEHTTNKAVHQADPNDAGNATSNSARVSGNDKQLQSTTPGTRRSDYAEPTCVVDGRMVHLPSANSHDHGESRGRIHDQSSASSEMHARSASRVLTSATTDVQSMSCIKFLDTRIAILEGVISQMKAGQDETSSHDSAWENRKPAALKRPPTYDSTTKPSFKQARYANRGETNSRKGRNNPEATILTAKRSDQRKGDGDSVAMLRHQLFDNDTEASRQDPGAKSSDDESRSMPQLRKRAPQPSNAKATFKKPKLEGRLSREKNHSAAAGNEKIWQVACREDFISKEEFCQLPESRGCSFVLVHSLLKYMSDMMKPKAFGRDKLLLALKVWMCSLEAKRK